MAAGSSKGDGGGEKPVITGASLASSIPQIFEDCLYNVIHDLVLETHRQEKILRMQSVAVHAESEASKATGVPSTPTTASTPSKPNTVPNSSAPQTSVETPSAKYENGRVLLKGNPLKTMKEIYCPQCKLPRLLFPITGAYSKLPENISRQYCTLHPFIQKPGHDIYGNPFPVDQTGMTKKELEALKKAERREKDNTPGSQEMNEDGTMTEEAGIKKLMAGGKPASYVPWQTCPQCKRSLLITKFAQHLEKCLGIGGRAARNAAVARLTGAAGTGSGSQHGSQSGSRAGTPTPSQLNGSKRENTHEDDDDNDNQPPKKKSKLLGLKDKKDRDRDRDSSTGKKDKDSNKRDRDRDREDSEAPTEPPASTKKKDKLSLKIGSGKLKSSSSAPQDLGKRPPKPSGTKSGTPVPNRTDSDEKSSSKRGRDRDEDDGDTPRKKIKVKEKRERVEDSE